MSKDDDRAEDPVQTVRPELAPHSVAAKMEEDYPGCGPAIVRFAGGKVMPPGIYLNDAEAAHKFTTPQLKALRNMINTELAGAGPVADYTEAERRAADYADRLRIAGFEVESDVRREQARQGITGTTLPPPVVAHVSAAKDGYRLTASWTTTLKGRTSTRFDGVSFGKDSPDLPRALRVQPRTAKSVGDLDALIGLEDLSRWKMISGFNRGER